MRVAVVAGARPQFIKAAALLPALRIRHESTFIHTGQHTSPDMVDVHFEGLGLPEPDIRLHAPAYDRGLRLTVMVGQLIDAFYDAEPECVIVMGDADTTLAAATAARGVGVKVAHVEAGARSGEDDLPEEHTRIKVDELSELLFCSTQAHADNLAGRDGVHVVGDVMADVVLAREGPIRERSPTGDYAVLTLHRAKTADDPEAVAQVLEAVGRSEVPVVFPRHPRTQEVEPPANVQICPPLAYLDFLGLVAGAKYVVTDSGGLQKECYLLGVPCITLRDATEWGETVDAGWNVLVGTDPERIHAALRAPPHAEERPKLYGDGTASSKIAELV